VLEERVKSEAVKETVMRKPVLITTLVSLISFGFVLAHSTVKTAVPADHAHVMTAPKTVTVNFDEKFETKSAVFKVYYLPMTSMMKNGKTMNSGQMDDVAEATMNKYVDLKKDTSSRVDSGMQKTTAMTKAVVLNLKSGLKPGVYVTMWKLKADDGDTVKGFIHFHFDGKM
jgi:copper resistance protein C